VKRLENRLKVQRAERDLTQAELAELAGIARRTVNAIEGGRMVPSIVVALSIARALGVPVDAIFSLPDTPDAPVPDDSSW